MPNNSNAPSAPPHRHGPDGRCEWCLAGEREAAIFDPAFCAVRAKRDPACRPADTAPADPDDARLVHDLRLHALDDCDGEYLPTHIANIAANRLAELSGSTTFRSPPTSTASDKTASTIAALTAALHDAINRPKGIVPASAEPFYRPEIADRLDTRANPHPYPNWVRRNAEQGE